MEAVVDLKYHPVFPNGGMATPAPAKKTRLGVGAAAAAGGETGVYRECLKNHAASLGGHALDGCGEFMPSPEADPADPSSLRCAACGCHRNFHRRLAELPPPPPLLALPPPPPPLAPPPPALAPAVASHVMRDSCTVRGEEEAPAADDRLPGAFDEETDEESDDGSDFDEDRPLPPAPPQPHGYRQQQAGAQHMLLALSTGFQTPAAAPPISLGPTPSPASSLAPMPPAPAPGTVPPGAAAAAATARKRFRTRFSPEQKQRMQALSERLGWRLQKRDEAVVDECCQEMGVTKGVFKVWMHNNKHNFVGGYSARRSASSASPAAATGAIHHHPSDGAAGAVVYRAAAPAPGAGVHPSAHAGAAPVLADFNIKGTAADTADYFRVQPSVARGGSPQSS